MLDEFVVLAESLKAASKGRTIVYIANPGNYGDGLIRYGTKQFLNDYGLVHEEICIRYSKIKYHLLPYLLRSERYFFVYGGGGAWCSAYGFAQSTCKFIDHFTDHYAVLPSTFALPNPPKKGIMFRRDKNNSIEFNPESRFCHDMAFYIALRTNVDNYVFAPPKNPVGVFMRTDHESKFGSASVPLGNVDLSLEGDHMSNGDDFLRRVAAFETIYTDRLHVCIAGIITGRKVKLVTGSYFKIKAIYEASILPNFRDQVELLPEGFQLSDLPRIVSNNDAD